jgi:hypothetical protein
VTVAVAVGWLVVGRLGLDPARDDAWPEERYVLASLLAAAGVLALRAYFGAPSSSQGEYSRLYRLRS